MGMGATIVTFEDKFPAMTRGEVAARFPSSTGDRTPPAPGVALGITATARVNGGRWIADCPDPDCGGAEYVSFEDPFLFCHECRNGRVSNQPVRIDLPDATTRARVEAYLGARPVPSTRNWHQEMSVKDIREENRAHGIRLGGSS